MIPRRMTDHLTAAIVVHERWLADLQDLLEGGLPGPVSADPGDDHACAFGAWLHGPDLAPGLRETAAWRVIARLHRECHEAAATVVQLAAQGRLAEAEAHFADACCPRSTRLIAGLRKWHAEFAAARAGFAVQPARRKAVGVLPVVAWKARVK